MTNLLQLIVMILAFIPNEHKAIAQLFPPPYTSFYLPLHKHTDAFKPLYSVDIMTAYKNSQFVHSNFLIDIDAPLTWHDCVVKRDTRPGSCPDNVLCTYPIICEQDQCTEVRASYSYRSPYCPEVRNTSTSPEGFCECPVNVMSPLNGSCGQPLLNDETLFVGTSNGRNPLPGIFDAFVIGACAPSSSFNSFPANVTGVAAFSSSLYSFTSFLHELPLKKAFALCLPSTSTAPGILFYGNGPYYLLPHTDVDVGSLLSFSPLVKQPDSFGYFISVNSIVIKNRSIEVLGNSPTKLSTIDPYTSLRTDIYNDVVRRFSKVTKRIPPAKPVAPFGLCFSTKTNGTKVGLKVPDIFLILQNGQKWSISTANSMKQITEDVACLAFVDGGATSEYPIIIGTFQFEDNFLLFDLENSNFGFSSSLLRKQTTCSNFNFTMSSS